jgi:translation initiation factor 5A
LVRGGHPDLNDRWSLGRPCKIVDMSTSKTGKHGHAKVNLVAIDVSYFTSLSWTEADSVQIFTNRKYVSIHFVPVDFTLMYSILQEDISPSTHNMDVPNVRRSEYQLVSPT